MSAIKGKADIAHTARNVDFWSFCGTSNALKHGRGHLRRMQTGLARSGPALGTLRGGLGRRPAGG